jgi:LmbE family N-acetylglucosaminyl deacetylase
LITPIVDEQTWLSALHGLPLFDPGDRPVAVISPHPDDETLAAGGLIAALRQRDVPVLIISVTDGENAYGVDPAGLRETRRSEQSSAVQELGASEKSLIRFGLTDSGVTQQREGLVEMLASHLSESFHVLAPWTGDFHPDHEVCGWAAQEAARQVGARLSWYFFWMWHRGTPALLSGMHLSAFPLTDRLSETKLRALAHHRSQLEHPSGQPILPDYLLAPARRKFEVFATS